MTLCGAALLVIVGLGFIHVVVGVEGLFGLPFDIRRREAFGYRELLVDAQKIRVLPYVAARSKYPLGCRVLQMMEYLPAGATFETRMVHELREAMSRWYAEFETAMGRREASWLDRLQEPPETADAEPQEAAAYNRRAIAAARQGRHDVALSELAGAIRKNPAFAEAFHNRALVYLALGNLGQAASDLGHVIEIRPESAPAYVSRGVIHITVERYDEAIADFTKAIEIDPACAEAYLRRSMVHYAQGDNDWARQDVRKLRNLGRPIPAGFLAALEGNPPVNEDASNRRAPGRRR